MTEKASKRLKNNQEYGIILEKTIRIYHLNNSGNRTPGASGLKGFVDFLYQKIWLQLYVPRREYTLNTPHIPFETKVKTIICFEKS